VVIPTHNRSELLPLTLRTVLWQRDVDLEVIVVDDGSSDETPEVVQRLGDDRVRAVRHEIPRGVSKARNRGMAEAHGRWIAFLDDDDLWGPDKLALQLHAAEESGRAWVYAGAVKINERHAIIGGTPPPPPEVVQARLPRWNLVPGGCSGVMAARSELAATGGFDPALVNLADWDLWIRLGAKGAPAYVPEPLVGYRLHAGQTSLDIGLILQEVEAIDGRYGTPVDRGAIHHYLAYKCLLAGRRREALRHFLTAASHGLVRATAVSMTSLIRRRITRHLPGSRRDGPDRFEEWRGRAEAWLGTV
jgi:glycosyltransferase involved in cell wall biosynthesis